MAGENPEQDRGQSSDAERQAEKSPDIIPTRPGTNSCAKTKMAENAEASTRPMITLSTPVQNRLASAE